MNKIILIIEDKPEQILIAKKAAADCGLSPLVASNLTDAIRLLEKMKNLLFAVATDLHYPIRCGDDISRSEQPNGLAIVALCIQNNIRVAVCSDINHHQSDYVKILVKVLETNQNCFGNRIPFIEDKKDWNYVIKELLTIK